MKSLQVRLARLEKAITERARRWVQLWQIYNDARAWDQERREYTSLEEAKKANPGDYEIWIVTNPKTIDLMIQLSHWEGRESQPQLFERSG
jgi:hypothetical protein